MKLALASMILARSLDATSTCLAFGRGAVEGDPLVPGSSCKASVAFQAALTTGQVFGLTRLSKTHPRLAQGLAWAVVAIESGAAFHNSRVAASAR